MPPSPLTLSQLLWCQATGNALGDVASGRCSACGGAAASFTSVKSVVSHNFTDWDRLDPTADGLCDACVWCLKENTLRKYPQIGDDAGAVTADAPWGEVRDALTAPVSSGMSITVPYGGRKHLVMFARPGYLSTDWGLLPWHALHVDLLRAVETLRSTGMAEGAIADGETLPKVAHVPNAAELLSAYGVVRSWRKTPMLLVALRVTRPVKVPS